ncbi:MAG: hypothetical protein HPAVJP_4250 [Candidatus Hepatoplasma vulgare]|nr:MAG: hypothetical protein HPAVJP_4250 [Candidatus Hepatoplasma sp.]
MKTPINKELETNKYEEIKIINNITDIKKWNIYNFNRNWLGEAKDAYEKKGSWRPCIVININKKSIHLLPLSSKPSREDFTIKFSFRTRNKPSYICVDLMKMLDPNKIKTEEVCKTILSINTNKNIKISKKLEEEIKDKIKKYTEGYMNIVL